METTLSLHSVSKHFDGRPAVADVSFTARRGLVTGLLGPNGAGKSTTMRMILDIIRPDGGTLEVLGSPHGSDVRRRLGYLPEERGLYPRMRAAEALAYFGELRGLTAARARSSAAEWLERLQLSDRARSPVQSLSKGLAQRVQFGCALVHDPEMVILDEPMSGLDPIAADLIRDIIMSLAHQDRKTVLLSTHDLDGAERLCEDLVMIDRGRVVLQGETAEIKARYGRRSVVIFFEGDAEFLRRHPAVKKASLYGGYADIELAPDSDVRSLLVDCAARLEINRFEKVEPTLAEIFRRNLKAAAP